MDVMWASADASFIFSPPSKCARAATINLGSTQHEINVSLSRNLAALLQGDGNDSPPSDPGDKDSGSSEQEMATDELQVTLPELDGRARRNQGSLMSSTPRPGGSRKRKNFTPSRAGSSSAHDEDVDTEGDVIPSSQRFISCSQAVREAVAARDAFAAGKPKCGIVSQPVKPFSKQTKKATDGLSVSLDFGSMDREQVSSTQQSTHASFTPRHIGPLKGKFSANTKPKSSRPTTNVEREDDAVIASSTDLALPNIRPRTQDEETPERADSSTQSMLRDVCGHDGSKDMTFGTEASQSDVGGSGHLCETARASEVNLDTSSSTDPEDVIRHPPKPIVHAKQRLEKRRKRGKELPAGPPHPHRRYAADYTPKVMAKPCRAYGTSTDSDDVSCWPEIKKKRRIVGKQSLFCKDKVISNISLL